MRRAGAAIVLGLAALCGVSCEDPSLPMGAGGFGSTVATGAQPGSGGGVPTPVQPTEEQWSRLQTLRWIDEPPPPDITNAYADDDDAAIFGQRLFFDARLSGPLLDHDNDGKEGSLGLQGQSGRVSCAGCHIPEAWFSDNRSPGLQISLAAGWVLRRTPPLLDVGHKKLLNWDARRDTFFGQAIGVFEAPKEMNSSRYFVALAMFEAHRAEYESIFGPMPPLGDTARFPPLDSDLAGCPHVESPPADCEGRPGDQGVYDALAPADQDAVTRVAVNTGKAIEAYLRKLSCGSGRFDAWLDGDDAALSDAEKRGAILFVEQGRCIDCHTGPRLTDDGFHNVGLMPDLVAVEFIDADDPGAIAGLTQAMIDPLNSRGPFSDGDDGRLPSFVQGSLLGAFSTPSLRCISRRPSFFHTGQERHLIYVLEHFNDGGHPDGFPGLSEILPLGLDDGQVDDIIAFLLSLDGPGPEAALLAPPLR